MKKISLVLLFIALVVVGIFIFLNLRAARTQFTVVKDSGTIYAKAEGEFNYTELTQDEVVLNNNTSVKTGENSFADIILSDNSVISLDQNTEITVQYADDSINIDQLVGNTWHRVKSITTGNNYQVETPNTIAAVRGTIFGVQVSANNETVDSSIFVEESNVDVQFYREVNGEKEILAEKNIKVSEFIKALNDSAENFNIEQTPENIKFLDWYKRNKIVDEVVKDFTPEDFRIFRKRLEQKLKERADFEAIRHFFKFRTFKIVETLVTCEGIDMQDVRNSLASLDGANVLEREQLRTFYSSLLAACEDNNIDPAELENLKNLDEQTQSVEFFTENT